MTALFVTGCYRRTLRSYRSRSHLRCSPGKSARCWIRLDVTMFVLSARALVRVREAPAQKRWCDQRRDEDHGDDRRVELVIDHSGSADHQRQPDIREDESHLASWDHSKADRDAVDSLTHDAEPAEL